MSVPRSSFQTWLCFIEYAPELTKCYTLSSSEVKPTDSEHKTKKTYDILIQYCRK